MACRTFEFDLGEHCVRFTQLGHKQARQVLDILKNALGPSLSSLVASAAKEGLDATFEISWPKDSTGLERVRDLYVGAAKVKMPDPAGGERWAPLDRYTDHVFGGSPGLEESFHILCTRAMFESFLAEAKSAGQPLRPV